MSDAFSLFSHEVIDNNTNRILFLLHGTGGSKEEFLFLDELLERKFTLVGLQGNVLEHRMARFFKRDASGVFDLESLHEEVSKLQKFSLVFVKKWNASLTQAFFLGYSNGANILLASLLRYPETFLNVILLHPMLPYPVKPNSVELSHHKIYISSGIHDQIIPHEKQAQVMEALKANSADPIFQVYQAGHEITAQEIQDAIGFLNNQI